MQIFGCDEVGRGSLAGPLIACSVSSLVIPRLPDKVLNKITDSKRLTPALRAEISIYVQKNNFPFNLSCITAHELNSFGMAWAQKEVFERLMVRHPGTYLIDGNLRLNQPYRSKAISLIKADTFIPAVSLASILAKHFRDEYMINLSQKYPDYRFELHKGYGTRLHRETILKNGPCTEHRIAFLRKLTA